MMPDLDTLLDVLQKFGPFGIVLVMWWFDMRAIRKVLDCYKTDMAEIRRMYESNVKLVQAYEGMAKDLKDVIIMNTQAFTRLDDDIEQNQFCPMVRLKKQAEGVVEA